MKKKSVNFRDKKLKELEFEWRDKYGDLWIYDKGSLYDIFGLIESPGNLSEYSQIFQENFNKAYNKAIFKKDLEKLLK